MERWAPIVGLSTICRSMPYVLSSATKGSCHRPQHNHRSKPVCRLQSLPILSVNRQWHSSSTSRLDFYPRAHHLRCDCIVRVILKGPIDAFCQQKVTQHTPTATLEDQRALAVFLNRTRIMHCHDHTARAALAEQLVMAFKLKAAVTD